MWDDAMNILLDFESKNKELAQSMKSQVKISG